MRRPVPAPPACTILLLGVAALEGQLELAVGPAVELDAAALELEHDRRRFVREDLGRRGPARPAPGGDGVRHVL